MVWTSDLFQLDRWEVPKRRAAGLYMTMTSTMIDRKDKDVDKIQIKGIHTLSI